MNKFISIYECHIALENKDTNNNAKNESVNRYTELKNKLLDLASLDVITARGVFDIIPNPDTGIDLIDAISKPPKSLTILARTHMQIDGDRCEIMPTEGVGTLTQEQITIFHRQAVDSALASRQERLNFLRELLDAIKERFPEVSLHEANALNFTKSSKG